MGSQIPTVDRLTAAERYPSAARMASAPISQSAKRMRSIKREVTEPVMRFNLVTLRLFIAVVEESSISRAAEREHIAASSASRRMAELEELLKTKLLYRTPNGVTSTPAGLAVLRHAKAVVRSLHEMASEVGNYSNGTRGNVRIWANLSSIVQYLPEDMASFTAQFPQISIALEEHMSRDIVKAVQEGHIDLGIIPSSVRVQGLETVQYREEKLILAIPSDHALAVEKEVEFARALQYDLVALPSASSIDEAMREAARAQNMRLRISVKVNSIDAMCRMIQAKVGIGVMPLGALNLYGKHLDIVPVRLRDAWAYRRLLVCAKKNEPLTAAARSFLAHLARSDTLLNASWEA